jgi:hypothetical protein
VRARQKSLKVLLPNKWPQGRRRRLELPKIVGWHPPRRCVAVLQRPAAPRPRPSPRRRYQSRRRHPAISVKAPTFRKDPNDVEATIQYCKGFKKNPETGQYEKKPGSAEFEEYGTPNKPGNRTDIAKMKPAIDDGATLAQIQMSDEHHQTWIQMPHATREYVNTVRRTNALKGVLDEYKDTEWKPWQAGILDMIDEKADSRC